MHTTNRTLFAATLLASTAGAALLLAPQQAKAEDCLLDRDNDGVVDAGTDNDAGANSVTMIPPRLRQCHATGFDARRLATRPMPQGTIARPWCLLRSLRRQRTAVGSLSRKRPEMARLPLAGVGMAFDALSFLGSKSQTRRLTGESSAFGTSSSPPELAV